MAKNQTIWIRFVGVSRPNTLVKPTTNRKILDHSGVVKFFSLLLVRHFRSDVCLMCVIPLSLRRTVSTPIYKSGRVVVMQILGCWFVTLIGVIGLRRSHRQTDSEPTDSWSLGVRFYFHGLSSMWCRRHRCDWV